MNLDESIEKLVKSRIPGRSRKAQEVREELTEHLLQSVRARQAEGLGEPEALERAMAELGEFRLLRRWLFWNALRAKSSTPQGILVLLSLLCICISSVLPIVTTGSLARGLREGRHYYDFTDRRLWGIGALAVPLYGSVVLALTFLLRGRPLVRWAGWACCVLSGFPILFLAEAQSRPSIFFRLALHWPSFLCLVASVMLAAASLWVGPRRSEVRTRSVAI
jgi:hypothetical protein